VTGVHTRLRHSDQVARGALSTRHPSTWQIQARRSAPVTLGRPDDVNPAWMIVLVNGHVQYSWVASAFLPRSSPLSELMQGVRPFVTGPAFVSQTGRRQHVGGMERLRGFISFASHWGGRAGSL